MNNIMLLLGVSDEDKQGFKCINEYLNKYFEERAFHKKGAGDDGSIIFIRNKEKFILEYLNIEGTCKYVVNIFVNYKINKREFIKELYLNKNVYKCIVLYDSNSNNLLINNYSKISKFENAMKFFLANQIAIIQGKCVFNIFDNLKVKEYIGKNYNNMISSLQSMELREIIEYINSNPLGGNEISILKSLSEEDNDFGELSQQKEKIKQKIENNIFLDVKKETDKLGINDIICECRNIIAHNSCIEEEIFIDIIKDIEELTNKVEKILIKNELNKKDMPNISILINSKNKPENILMRIIELIDNKFNNNILKRIMNRKNIEIKEEMDKICLSFKDTQTGFEINILEVNPELKFEHNIDGDMYKISIYLGEDYLNTRINDYIYIILGELCNKFIVLYDNISEMFRNELYLNINSVENLSRLYIKLSQIILSKDKDKRLNSKMIKKNALKMKLDLNALKIDIDDNKINLINNDLYDLDFIALMDKLSNPLIEKSYADLINNTKDTGAEHFNRAIADLSSLDDNIESISCKWKELYRIRTMVAHNFVMDIKSYEDYKNLYLEANEEIKQAVYRLFTENLVKEGFVYEVKCDDINLKFDNYNKDFRIELLKSGKIMKIYIINKYDICKTINYLLNMNLYGDTIFLTKNTLEELKNINRSNINEKRIDDILIKNKIEFKEQKITEKDCRIVELDREISKLLRIISDKWKE